MDCTPVVREKGDEGTLFMNFLISFCSSHSIPVARALVSLKTSLSEEIFYGYG